MPIIAPRRMRNDDVSSTPELSGGGGPLQSFGGVAGNTPGRECPGEAQEMWPLAGTSKPSSGTVSDDDSRSPCGGGGALPPSVVAGGLLPVDVTDAPALSVEDLSRFPRRFRWCWSMGPWLGTLQECPREDRDWRPPKGSPGNGT